MRRRFVAKMSVLVVEGYMVSGVHTGLMAWILATGTVLAASSATEELDSITVTSTADRVHRTGDVVLDETPTFSTIIERDRFEGRLTSLADVIEGETGVQVRQSGGLGSFSIASLRGSSSQQVTVYLDGLPLNEASGGGVDLSQISLADVGSIEIYRGVTPINFAHASIGGAINIQTLRVEDDHQLRVNGGYGSFDTRRAGVMYLGGKGAWDSVLTAEYFDTDNDFEFTNDNGTEFNSDDDRRERRNNAQVTRGSGLFKLGRELDNSTRLDFLFNVFDKDQGLPSRDNSSANDASLDTFNLNTNLRLTADRIAGHPWNATVRAFASRRRENYDDSDSQIGLAPQKTHDITWRYGLQSYVERTINQHVMKGIVEFSRETYDSEDKIGQREDIEASRNAIESGVQATMFYFNEDLLLTPAVRLQSHWDDFDGGVGSSAETYVNPQGGAKLRVADGIVTKTNLGRYVRLPSFFELFGDRGFVIGNPRLDPERGINFDVGVHLNKQLSTPFLHGLDINLAYFYSDVDDLISFVFDSRGVGRAVNISRAEIHGVELGASLAFSTSTFLSVNATWQDPENRSDIAAFAGERLPGRYSRKVFLRVEQLISRFKLYYEFDHESGLFYDAANLLSAKDVNKHNLGVNAELGRWRLGFEAKNLSDENFEDFNGFPTPGLAFFGTAIYRFDL